MFTTGFYETKGRHCRPLPSSNHVLPDTGYFPQIFSNFSARINCPSSPASFADPP